MGLDTQRVLERGRGEWTAGDRRVSVGLCAGRCVCKCARYGTLSEQHLRRPVIAVHNNGTRNYRKQDIQTENRTLLMSKQDIRLRIDIYRYIYR